MREILPVRSKIVAVDQETVFDSILALSPDNCTINVCLASIVDDETIPTFERLLMADTLTEEFRNIVKHFIKKYQKERYANALLFPEYAPESKPPEYEIECIELSKYSDILEQLSPLKALIDIDVFDEDTRFVPGIRFYVIVMEPSNGDPIYFYRFHTSKKTLAQSRFIPICWQNGSYNRIKEHIFLFDQEIDCVSRGSLMFIFNSSNFQHIFHFLEEIQHIARKTLADIQVRVPIKNFEELLAACEGNMQKLRKLNNIAERPYIDRITMEHIKLVIKKHNLSVQIEEVNGQEMIVYDKRNPWVILKLLDDDYLWSLLTEHSYEVNGKRKLA